MTQHDTTKPQQNASGGLVTSQLTHYTTILDNTGILFNKSADINSS